MSYASEILGDRTLFDADGHIMEEPGWLHAHADPDVREHLLPPFGVDAEQTALVEEIMPGTDFDQVQKLSDAERIRLAEQDVMQTKNYRALGSFRSEERPHALDLIGVEKQVVFATDSIAYFDVNNTGVPLDRGTLNDPRVLYGGARAHNRGMAEFCKADDRLLATSYVPLDDPERSADLVSEALAFGCQAFNVPHSVPPERSWSHPEHDVVWERIADSGRPMLLHVGAGDKTLRFPEAVYNNGRPPQYLLGEHTWQMPDLMSWHWPAELMLTQLVLDGVFERFPKLRCGVIELRASWVPSFIGRLDWTQNAMYGNREYPAEYRLPMKASDYVKRQVKFTPWAQGGDPLASMIDSVEGGEGLYLFSTDYPHDEGGVDPIGDFEAEFEKLAQRSDIDTIRDRFYRDNFAELFGVE